MKKTLYLLVSCIFLSLGVYAQHYQPTRVDVKIDKNWSNFRTVACGENGIINYHIESEGGFFSSKPSTLVVSLFDKDLEKEWTEKSKIGPNLIYIDHAYDDVTKKIYILFADATSQYNKKSLRFSKDTEVQIFVINANSGLRPGEKKLRKVTHRIEISDINYYKNMIPAGNKLFLFLEQKQINFLSKCCNPILIGKQLSYKDKHYMNFMLDVEKSSSSKVVNFPEIGDHLKYVSSYVNRNGDIDLLTEIEPKSKKSHNKHILYTIDKENGTVENSLHMNKDVHKTLQFSSSVMHKENQTIFVSMFGEDNRRVKSGFLFRLFEKDKLIDEQEYTLEEIAGEDNRDKILGLFNTKDVTYMRFHPKSYSLDNEGNYLLIGEKLSPYLVTYYYTNANGTTSSRTVHEGWIYNEAYLMAFDKDNQLKWSYTFDMGDVTYRDLNLIPRLVVDKVTDEDLYVTFGLGNEITSLQISEAEVADEQEFFKLKSQFKDSRIKSTYTPTIEYWYDDYFIASGYVVVKKSDFFLSGKDQVYYFTKLKYDR